MTVDAAAATGVRHRSQPLPALWPVSERVGGHHRTGACRLPPRAPGQTRGPRAASAGLRQALPSLATAMPGASTGRYRARPVVVGAERTCVALAVRKVSGDGSFRSPGPLQVMRPPRSSRGAYSARANLVV